MERTITERQSNVSNLGTDEILRMIENLLDNLPAQALMKVKEIAETKRLEKLDEAETAVVDEMRQKLAELGSSYDVVIRKRKKRENTATLPAKYRGPNGEAWSGRGFAPQWLRTLEEAGHDREEYRIEITHE